MKITILGAAGFIGTNLAIRFSKVGYELVLVDEYEYYFDTLKKMGLRNTTYKTYSFSEKEEFCSLLDGTDIVIDLESKNIPGDSNQCIPIELQRNIIVTAKLLDACVKAQIKKFIFISSGGTVYGNNADCPILEDAPTFPISSYGIQKITIEKLLYLYKYLYDLDYRVLRLANPYGPYQRPNGRLGVVTNFIYKALKNEVITVYGDGSVIRDFIYIDDVIEASVNIIEKTGRYNTYNIGSGLGISIKQLILTIEECVGKKVQIEYRSGRAADVPVNYLDITRYESDFGKLVKTFLKTGIQKTCQFFLETEDI